MRILRGFASGHTGGGRGRRLAWVGVPEALESRRLLTVPALVGGVVSGVTDPQAVGAIGGVVYVLQDSPSPGSTLRLDAIRTPGSAPVMVKDVSAGTEASIAAGPVVVVGNKLFFRVDDPASGLTDLWVSDGTPAGTVDLEEFNGHASLDLTRVAVLGGVLYFGDYGGVFAGNGPTSATLYRSDGTKAGTAAVETWSGASSISNLAVLGGRFLFDLNTGRGEYLDLYASDGTAAGTSLILTAATAVAEDLTPDGPLAFFLDDDTFAGTAADDGLWVTDGTASGTRRVDGVRPGPMVAFGANVDFPYDDGTHGDELWTSDGTAGGTRLVADLSPGPGGSDPTDLTVSGGVLYLVAQEGVDGFPLIRSDGTAGGTRMIKVVDPAHPHPSTIDDLTDLGGRLFFEVIDGSTSAPWISDGTTAGTVSIPVRGADLVLSDPVDPVPTGDGGIVLVGTAQVIQLGATSRATTKLLRVSTTPPPMVDPADFDGDGTPDLAVFGKDPRDGKYDFRVLTSTSGFDPGEEVAFDNRGYGFGDARSIPVPGDYFGGGMAAFAVWSPNSLGGMTLAAISPVGGKSMAVNFGETSDVPVVADVDGDGKADFGVYGFAKGLGYRFDFLLSSDGFDVKRQSIFNNNGDGFGNSGSIPVVADFDGNGHADFGLFNASAKGSTFTSIDPITQASVTRSIGTASDEPTAVDFDGDGKADLTLYGPDPSKPGHFRYEVLTSSTGFDPASAVSFDNFGSGYGNALSVPVVADYQGVDRPDFAVFLPITPGGSAFIYQTGQVGQGVTVPGFATTDIALTSPAYLRARKVRGV